MKTINQKVVRIGCGRYGSVFCKINFDGKRLSISGVVGPTRDGNATGGCGQIDIEKEDIAIYAERWNKDLASKFAKVWKDWHLNDMRSGCQHQRDEKWSERPIDPSKPLGAYGKHFEGQKTDSWNMLTWITRKEHPEGLMCEPCKVCGYKYGTAWLLEEVPQEVIEFLDGLPHADRTPAWI